MSSVLSVVKSSLILGLESSCDETAAAVVRGGREVLSNVIASQYDLHAEYAGVVPEIASRAHVERMLPVVRRALSDAGVSLGDIDAIAVGHRPGLIGSLLIAVSAAKALAWSLGKPLIGIDHVHAHLYAGFLSASPAPGGTDLSPHFPALGLVVSGGHTALYHLESPLKLARLGSTIDDAVGEAYDKAATILSLPHPGGPALDRLAQRGDERAFDFPISRLASGSLDFSFSGLKTAVLYAVRGVPQEPSRRADRNAAPVPREPLSASRYPDVAASFQRAAVGAVMLKLARALDQPHIGPPISSLLIGGGVSANSRLRAELQHFAAERGVRLFLPAMPYCLDNAAMIAGLAHHRAFARDFDDLTLGAHPSTSAA